MTEALLANRRFLLGKYDDIGRQEPSALAKTAYESTKATLLEDRRLLREKHGKIPCGTLPEDRHLLREKCDEIPYGMAQQKSVRKNPNYADMYKTTKRGFDLERSQDWRTLYLCPL